MGKIKYRCPTCGKLLQCDEKYRGKKSKCPHCKKGTFIPQLSVPPRRTSRHLKKKILMAAIVSFLLVATIFVWMISRPVLRWPDRRPLGVLFLASDGHTSATNPRGWFNEDSHDFTGPEGAERFHKELLDYADRSIAILKSANAQGAIVWDLEGEQFPHKTTYIGDPELLDRLAPEMASVADEFFQKFHDAGLRVGLTIRPQCLAFDKTGAPRQTTVINIRKNLLQKIDYARKRWGVSIFYVDSNSGLLRPDELWQLRSLAKLRPDVLLIPEHHFGFYRAFSAPYTDLQKVVSIKPSKLAQKLWPASFLAVNISGGSRDEILAAQLRGDILLFPAWYSNEDSQLLQNLNPHASENPAAETIEAPK